MINHININLNYNESNEASSKNLTKVISSTLKIGTTQTRKSSHKTSQFTSCKKKGSARQHRQKGSPQHEYSEWTKMDPMVPPAEVELHPLSFHAHKPLFSMPAHPPLLKDLHFTSTRTPTLPPPIERRLLPESETEISQGFANSSSFHQPSQIPAEEKATPQDGIRIETATTKMTAQAPESSISQSENNNLSIGPMASSSGVSHSHIRAAIALLEAYKQGNLDLRDSVEGALRLIGKPTPQDKQSSP